MLNSFSAVIKESILTEVEKKFKTAQLLKAQTHHKVGKHVINALFNSKELNYTSYMEFFGNDKESDEVLGGNVFAYHPATNTVTFQSQSVYYYIQEKAHIFLK